MFETDCRITETRCPHCRRWNEIDVACPPRFCEWCAETLRWIAEEASS